MKVRALACALLALSSLSACAGKRVDTQQPPAWSTPDGKQQARLDMVQIALDAGNPNGALTMLASLRDDGAHGPEIDLLHGRALAAAQVGRWT